MEKDNQKGKRERTRCEIYTRVVGFLRPVQQWNKGKQEEYCLRTPYNKQIENSKEE